MKKTSQQYKKYDSPWRPQLLALCRVLIAVVALVLVLSPDAKSDESDVGIVLMHGKWAGPPALQGLTKALSAKGFKLITPVMPWGLKRKYDADYPTALSEIEASVEILRKKGAKRIIVAGHSFGANASIAYAASGREADGLIAISPGHCPDLDNFGASVAKARQMIAYGKAEETASFEENQAREGHAREKRTAGEFAANGRRQIGVGAVLLAVGVVLSIGLLALGAMPGTGLARKDILQVMILSGE